MFYSDFLIRLKKVNVERKSTSNYFKKDLAVLK